MTSQTIWNNHPYPDTPCDATLFPNQCAIRMGQALVASGVNMNTFGGVRCWVKGHSPKHVLRAQQLADWMVKQKHIFGPVTKYTKKVSNADFDGKKGLVFIKDGWGPTDHIDVWDGKRLRGGSPEYFAMGKQVWFWEL